MNLLQAKTKEEYIIDDVLLYGKIKNRLLTFGIIKGSKIVVINKKFKSALIVRIRGTRLGISERIAKGIFVK